jgi:hypothetical protein
MLAAAAAARLTVLQQLHRPSSTRGRVVLQSALLCIQPAVLCLVLPTVLQDLAPSKGQHHLHCACQPSLKQQHITLDHTSYRW